MRARPSASTDPPQSLAPAWWTVLFVVLTTAGLGLFTWGLLIMHAMTYGTLEVLRPQGGVVAPALDNYVRALLVGVMVNVVVAFGMVGLADKTLTRVWHPIIVAAIAALAGAVVASSASLLMLGISPVTFLLTL